MLIGDTHGAILRTCIVCNRQFEILPSEVAYLERQGWQLPKRCKRCRKQKKLERLEHERHNVSG